MKKKHIICGTRDFDDPELLDDHLNPNEVEEVVSGGQKKKGTYGYMGADYNGEQWADANGIPVKRFPANWGKHGKAAGPIRNQEMADYVGPDGVCVAFWDGQSTGTKDMIGRARRKGMEVRIITY